jgi:hypothetical protein
MRLVNLTVTSTEIQLADGTEILFSYETPVAARIPGRGFVRTDKFYGKATKKHIEMWLKDKLGRDVVPAVDQWELEKLVAI